MRNISTTKFGSFTIHVNPCTYTQMKHRRNDFANTTTALFSEWCIRQSRCQGNWFYFSKWFQVELLVHHKTCYEMLIHNTWFRDISARSRFLHIYQYAFVYTWRCVILETYLDHILTPNHRTALYKPWASSHYLEIERSRYTQPIRSLDKNL